MVLNYTTRDLIITTVMGRAKQKERERKRSAASCQRLDNLFQKKSKVSEEEVIAIDSSSDDGSADELLTDSNLSLSSGNIASYL